MKIEELRNAAKELVEVLGLVDKKKKPLVITDKMKEAELEKIIQDALELIDPEQDEFSKKTQAVIDSFQSEDEDTDDDSDDEEEEDTDDDSDDEEEEDTDDDSDDEEEEEELSPKKGKATPTVKGKKAPARVEEDDEEEEKPKKGKERKSGEMTKAGFKHEGSFAAFLDETVKTGGTWDEMFAETTKEAKKRGIKTTLSQLKNHAKFRISKDDKFLGKKKMREDGIR